ncbi:hypothetical protein F2Q70_00001168 [Brassica cretica]|uniref:Uncharacterized protein n=1 Tax=Brassica cretica TaxID=69181 RepID=A0A8S9J1Q5_BRACR|nr:hypothetical protein F2Q70_00001168 [Brassica cretica]
MLRIETYVVEDDSDYESTPVVPPNDEYVLEDELDEACTDSDSESDSTSTPASTAQPSQPQAQSQPQGQPQAPIQSQHQPQAQAQSTAPPQHLTINNPSELDRWCQELGM